jgi:hypothetical protein
MNLHEWPIEPFEVIHVYTRKQAIADGVLVDMTQDKFGEALREAGFHRHTAMTATAFAEVIGDADSLPSGQDQVGRWWDVLTMMRFAIAAAIHKSPSVRVDNVPFKVRVWNGTKHEAKSLYVNCGPGDNAEPVLTIMLEGED